MMPNVKTNNAHLFILGLPRQKAGQLIRWLTGHISLNRQLKIMSIESEAKCRLCEEEEETPLHLLECPRLHWLSEEAFNRPDINEGCNRIRRMSWFISHQQIQKLMSWQGDVSHVS